jgi:hypothetical protein
MTNIHPRYAKMTFPPYAFKEYPKWVTTAAGESKLCANRAEEIRLATNEGIALSADQQKEADYIKVLKEQNEAMEAMRAEIEALKTAKPTVTVHKDLPGDAPMAPSDVPLTPAGKPVQPSKIAFKA